MYAYAMHVSSHRAAVRCTCTMRMRARLQLQAAAAEAVRVVAGEREASAAGQPELSVEP